MSREQDYSTLDRALHRLAFSSRSIQLSAADIERTIYGSLYRDIEIRQPVFITSLPRAGTTLLLEIFSRIPNFATHCYRDMPFILAPLLWQRISGGFRKQTRLKERAHGDGMQIGYDSPEAFEEVAWRAHWPQKYRSDCILTWTEADNDAGFGEFLTEHMKKIIALRALEQPGACRYVSKNNANIARIGFLKKLFPDAVILVPFRHPVDHAASMHRQHMNFHTRHREGPFAKRYMRDIGHFEFGSLHRPLRFDSDVEPTSHGQPDSLDYWLAYWITAFGYVVRQHRQVMLLSYEQACDDGAASLKILGRLIDHGFSNPPAGLADIFRPPTRYEQGSAIHDSKLLDRALTLHEELIDKCILTHTAGT